MSKSESVTQGTLEQLLAYIKLYYNKHTEAARLRRFTIALMNEVDEIIDLGYHHGAAEVDNSETKEFRIQRAWNLSEDE